MSREKLLALRKKAMESKARTEAVREDRVAKKAKRKAPPRVSEMTASQRRRKTNSTHVEAWFREGLFDLYGKRFVVPQWTIKQKKLAKSLLEIYGEALVNEAVAHFCKTWDNVVGNSNGRLSGSPTINLLWGMRERVFGDVQNKGRKIESRKNSDEFKGDSGAPDVGW